MKLKGLSPVAYRTQSFRIIPIMLNGGYMDYSYRSISWLMLLAILINLKDKE